MNNLNNLTTLDLVLAEGRRIKKLWEVRESMPRRETLDMFLDNMKLQNDNRETFDEIFNRFN